MPTRLFTTLTMILVFVAVCGCLPSVDTPMSTSTAHAIEVTKEATPATKTAKHANAVDPTIPPYKKVNEAVSGSIKSIGSDTMNNLMAKWAEGFKKLYPNVTIEIEGKGTATAPPALIAGTANFGPMSRQMKGKEIDDFEKKFGYKPLALPTGLDMLAVYVHKDNPLKGLTLQQVDAIYSKTRKGGADRAITTWGELGLTGEWKDKPISLYGRNAASGTYGYFKDYALFGGDYKNSVKEQPGSSAVVQGVASDKYAMGYSGIGYKTADVIALPLAAKAGVEFAAPEAQNAYNGKYPLSRFLYVYINQRPGKPLDALRREFIKYIMSQDGQRDVVNGDYLPIPYKVTQRALESVLVVPPAPLKTGGR